MSKALSHTDSISRTRPINFKKGFSLVEILVAVSIFLIFVITFSDINISVGRQIRNTGNRERATALADEALEATRSIRDDNFANLTDGTYGIATTSNQWNLSGSSDVTDIFNRHVDVSTVSPNQKQIVATVSWADQVSATNSVILNTYLTDWKKTTATCTTMASCLSVDTSGVSRLGNVQVTGITLTNTNTTASSTIDRIRVSWTGGASNNRIIIVRINGTNQWTGSATSGTLLNITDFVLNANTTYPLTYLEFSKNITGATLSITFTMTDASTKTVSGIVIP